MMDSPIWFKGHLVLWNLPPMEHLLRPQIRQVDASPSAVIGIGRQGQHVVLQPIDGCESWGGNEGLWKALNFRDGLLKQVGKPHEMVNQCVGETQVEITLGSMFDDPTKA